MKRKQQNINFSCLEFSQHSFYSFQSFFPFIQFVKTKKNVKQNRLISYAFNVFISNVDCKKHEGQRLLWAEYLQQRKWKSTEEEVVE